MAHEEVGELRDPSEHEREMCFKTIEEVSAGKTEGWMEWEGISMVDEGDNCKKDLRLIGNKFHGRGKELQTERPENLSM